MKTFFTYLRDVYHKIKAKRQFIKYFANEIEKDKILKDWISECIITRKQEFRRKEMVEMQDKLNEDELFVKWLRERSVL